MNRLSHATNRDPTSDALSLFFERISCVPLLSADQELELARRIERGDLEAKAALIEANLRLVVSIARKYQNLGMPLLDLVQEGCIGLVRAAEKYDHRRQLRFSSYATWWVRNSVARAIADKGRLIRLPVHIGGHLIRIRRARDELSSALGREPTLAELESETGVEQDEIERILQRASPIASLESPVGSGPETLRELLADPTQSALEEGVEANLLLEQVIAQVKALPDTERAVLESRYGLSGNAVGIKSLRHRLQLTADDVESIHSTALARLHELCA